MGNIALFVAVVLVWLVIDQLSKAYMDSFKVGDTVLGPYLGLIEFVLVHNTGAAWGMFGDMTHVLAIVSLGICVLILVYLFAMASQMSRLSAFALALVFAGGLGNAIDRFVNSYVIDFISTTFVDFPVFNIADIGVTCGVALFVISLIVQSVNERRDERACSEQHVSGSGMDILEGEKESVVSGTRNDLTSGKL